MVEYGDRYERVYNSAADLFIVHYLCSTPEAEVLLVTREDGEHLYYVQKDLVGSWVVITDEQGAVVDRHSFDAWGVRRCGDTCQTFSLFRRGFGGHEEMTEFGLINMNGRVYDPLIAMFLSPDPYIQAPDFSQSYNRYGYCLNNPMKYTDPSGEIAWFIPVIIGAALGTYTGASIQSGTAAFWDWKPDAWKGAIAGAIAGATLGFGISSAIGAEGLMVKSVSGLAHSKAAGITSSMLYNGTINIGLNSFSGSGWDGAWKSGLVGLATGAWNSTGGFGIVKAWGATNEFAKLGGKLGYQIIGTSGASIGNNWANGDGLFSKVQIGIGPVNLTFGKNQRIIQWQNNIGNILTNGFGLINLGFGGTVSFDWKNLSLNYTSGLVDKFFDPISGGSGFGAHSVIGNSKLFNPSQKIYSHELHHLWQSRAFGDKFLLNYGLQGLVAMFGGSSFIDGSFFEDQAYNHVWW